MRMIRFSNLGIAPLTQQWNVDRPSVIVGCASTPNSLEFELNQKPDVGFNDSNTNVATGVSERTDVHSSMNGTQLNIPIDQNQVIYCNISGVRGSVWIMLEDQL